MKSVKGNGILQVLIVEIRNVQDEKLTEFRGDTRHYAQNLRHLIHSWQDVICDDLLCRVLGDIIAAGDNNHHFQFWEDANPLTTPTMGLRA